MKLLVGAVSASLIAAFAAQAEPLAPSGVRAPYAAVSDFDTPYSELPPPAPVPGQPRYGYGPDVEYGYRSQRYVPPAPVYRQDGYQQDYGYAPAFLPMHEVYAVLRDHGFSPLGAPRQRGNVYIVAVLDRDGEDGRLVVDARSGRIIRFVPAFQWGEQYERMRYEPAPQGGLDRLPPPSVIRADPRLVPAMPGTPRVATATPPPPPKVAMPAARPAVPSPQTAALNPRPPEATKATAPKATDVRPAEAKPADVKPADTKPVEAKADEAKLPEAKAPDGKPADPKPVQSAAAPPQTTGSVAPSAAAKPAPQIQPTAKMPPAQGLD